MTTDIHDDLLAAIKDGTITDERFDTLYPPLPRAVSASCWTPIAVIKRVCEWFADIPEGSCILDVGSGAGKFVHVGAAMLPTKRFLGLELRQDLLDVAVKGSLDLGLPPDVTAFRLGGLAAVDFAAFRAAYLYNPFEESAWDRWACPDNSEEDARRVFLANVEEVEGRLSYMENGARVVTYCGFGGELPKGFFLHAREDVCGGQLELWIRGIPYDWDGFEPSASRPTGKPLDTEGRAHRCVDRFVRLPATEQGRIGVILTLISEIEYRSCPTGTLAEFVFTRARKRGLMDTLERMIGIATTADWKRESNG